MLKWVFDGLPFQCETTGLRFSTREKLRRHNEGLKKRKEQRQALVHRSVHHHIYIYYAVYIIYYITI